MKWTRSALVLLIALGAVKPLAGQGALLGWKLGVVRSNVARPGDPEYQPLVRQAVAIFVTWQATRHLGLQPELLYAVKGTRLRDVRQLSFDYFQLPLLLRYDLRSSGIKPHLFAGPTLALMRSCSLFEERSGDLGCWYWTEQDIQRRDITATGGAGVDFPTAHAQLHVEVRYDHGFRSILAGYPATRTRALVFMFGIAMRPHPYDGP